MIYNVIVMKILNELGIHKKYKGVKYILTCIDYMEHHQHTFMPVTKFLYVDVAKIHKSSRYNVEQGIRRIIERIWDCKENSDLVEQIFDKTYDETRPTNTEFLLALYEYVKWIDGRINGNRKVPGFMCPKCKEQCPFLLDIIIRAKNMSNKEIS